ncbi:MAG TPA: ferritin-like domain-containing protein [Nitrosomonas sp.]|nr:ferritin-like domain-containing protein [Nitrosomonas sp.]
MAEKTKSLDDLYVKELQDLYSAENQLLEVLPKLAKKARDGELRQGFEEHLEMTKEHVRRIEQIIENHEGATKRGKKCMGMAGIIKEGEEMMQEKMDRDVIDAALIAAAQHAEHYEIAGYGTCRTYAEQLGENDAAKILQMTLDEEIETDRKLTKLAESWINQKAV